MESRRLPARSFAAALLLGFGSGFPLLLTGDTLQAWLTERGLSLAEIGAATAIGLPYALKPLWSPLLDRLPPPFLDQRRGWIVTAQIATAAALVVLALAGGGDAGGPSASLLPLVVAAVCVAFASATQDIVVDAWRAETFPERSAAAGASLHVIGYRVAMIASGGGAFLLKEGLDLSWSAVYLCAAGALSLGLVGALLAPPTGAVRATTFLEAVRVPLADLLLRKGALFVLAFVVLFKLPDVVAGSLTVPFLKKAGYSLEQIGVVRQGLGLLMTILGTIVGGAVAAGLGLRRALLVYGVLQAVSNLAFWWLAGQEVSTAALATTVALENFCAGLVTAGFLGFLQSQCSPGSAATQFALLTSLMAIPARTLGGPAGALAESLGWRPFFLLTVALGLPGLLLVPLLRSRADAGGVDAPAPVPKDADGV